MNPQVKEKWVSALRSGEYQQGAFCLRSDQGFCCLGVLCDLYAKEHNENWNYVDAYEEQNTIEEGGWYFDKEKQFLPSQVIDWAELENENPEVKICDKDGYLIEYEVLSTMNDEGASFSIIADTIEKYL